MLKHPLLMLLLLWPFSGGHAFSDEAGDVLVQLKVAYIYNFTRFIDWPSPLVERPFVVAVIGDPEIERGLRNLEAEGKEFDGRAIEIRNYANIDAIESCEVLFVGSGASGQLEAIVERTARAPTLLIGDTPGYASRGVAIEFFLKPDIFREKQKLRFRINPAALADRGLAVSSQLMDVAEVVR